MISAYVLTPWVVQEEPVFDKDGQPTGEVERQHIPAVALMETRTEGGEVRGVPYTEVSHGQYVNLPHSPDPNLVVIKVMETGSRKDLHKHEGLIEDIKKDSRFLVLEEWEDDTPSERVSTVAEVSDYLKAAGVSAVLADEIANKIEADVSVGEKLAEYAKTFEKRAAQGK